MSTAESMLKRLNNRSQVCHRCIDKRETAKQGTFPYCGVCYSLIDMEKENIHMRGEIYGRHCKRTGRRLRSTNKSDYEGVSMLQCGDYAAHVFNYGKRIYLGKFEKPEDASAEIEQYWKEISV